MAEFIHTNQKIWPLGNRILLFTSLLKKKKKKNSKLRSKHHVKETKLTRSIQFILGTIFISLQYFFVQ